MTIAEAPFSSTRCSSQVVCDTNRIAPETTISLELDGPVARLALDDPERMNPISSRTVIDLLDAFERIASASVRVVLFTGRGRAFSAGVALDDPLFTMRTRSERQPTVDRAYELIRRMRALPAPIVAGVHGHCVGVALVLVAACDVRLADPGARFSLPYVQRVAVPPDMGGTVLLPRLLGTARAMELALAGERLDAAEAARIGLIGRVVASGALTDELERLGTRIAAAAPLAVAACKRLMYASSDAGLDAGLAAEAEVVNGLFDSADFAEAMAAFAEQRDPSFEGA